MRIHKTTKFVLFKATDEVSRENLHKILTVLLDTIREQEEANNDRGKEGNGKETADVTSKLF